MSWYPNAVRYICNKHSYSGRTFRPVGAVIHSFDGYAPNHYPLLDDPNRRGSWAFSILFDGTVEQHVDSSLASWHCGDMEGNLAYWGIEIEGRHSNTPPDGVTDAQVTSLADLLKWLWDTHGLAPFFIKGATLKEHRSFGTSSCPNERYTGDRMWNRLMAELGEDDDMPNQFTDQEAIDLKYFLRDLLANRHEQGIDMPGWEEIRQHLISNHGNGGPHQHADYALDTHKHGVVGDTGPAIE